MTVDSVNGQTGDVVLDAADVGAVLSGRAPTAVHDQADDTYGIGAYKVFQVPADTDGPVLAVGLVGDAFPRWLLTGYGLYLGDGTVDPYGGSPAISGGVDGDGNATAETHAPWVFTQRVTGIPRVVPASGDADHMRPDGYDVNTHGDFGVAFGRPDDEHASLVLLPNGEMRWSLDGDVEPWSSNVRGLRPFATPDGVPGMAVRGLLVADDGVVLRAPGGTLYALGVDDDGNLTVGTVT